MKRARRNCILTYNNVFYGINLGWDFVCEHERGINRINKDFVIDSSRFGIEGRVIHNNAGVYLYHEIKNRKYCYYLTRYNNIEDLYVYSNDLMVTGWGDGCFGIGCKSIYKQYLYDLYYAFRYCDIAIYLNPLMINYEHMPLYIVIPSLMPEYEKEQLFEYDKQSRHIH